MNIYDINPLYIEVSNKDYLTNGSLLQQQMEHFDDEFKHTRKFDNFQFVEYNKFMNKAKQRSHEYALKHEVVNQDAPPAYEGSIKGGLFNEDDSALANFAVWVVMEAPYYNE